MLLKRRSSEIIHEEAPRIHHTQVYELPISDNDGQYFYNSIDHTYSNKYTSKKIPYKQEIPFSSFTVKQDLRNKISEKRQRKQSL